MGKFAACYDSKGNMLDKHIVPNKTICLAMGYSWLKSNVNFDNVLSGFIALLQMGTFSGWYDILADMMDSPAKKDLQPSFNAHPAYALYFVIFIVVGVMFMLNLFIGVIVDNYSSVHKKVSSRSLIIIHLDLLSLSDFNKFKLTFINYNVLHFIYR